jgi:glycosyltransferase involved in cell wall biosynthesis
MEPAQLQLPKISIIIPAYNTAHLVAACLDSIFAQTYSDFEIIIVNDGSPDTSDLERVLKPYFQNLIYIRQENKRAAGARNTAIHRAKGEFLAFVDSDDSWFSDHLASQMALFEADPSLDMVYSDALLLADVKRQAKFMDSCPSYGEPTFEALIFERCQIPISTVVARKRAIEKAGFFDESLPQCDDYDLWLRTAFYGAKIGYTRGIQARLNGGRPGSLSQSRPKSLEAYCIILENARRTLPLSDIQRDFVNTRATEIRARYLVELGKRELSQRNFKKARELFSEANKELHELKLAVTVLGLRVAPVAIYHFVSRWHTTLAKARLRHSRDNLRY